MKNARQHKQQQAAAAAANAAHGTLLEVPTELERSNSSVSTTKITKIICFKFTGGAELGGGGA